MRIPNIYAHKNIKLLIAVPIALMLIGIYFSTKLTLDSSLRGGASIIFETNSTLSAQQLSTEISSGLHITGVEIEKSPGGFQVTLPINQSLADSNIYVTEFDIQKANYSSFMLNYTTLSILLQRDPTNSTLIGELSSVNASIATQLANMRKTLNSELSALASFGVNMTVNESNPDAMQAATQLALTKAGSVYENRTISSLRSILSFSSYSIQQTTPTLGRFFLSQLRNIIITAFVLVFLAVLVIFRSPIPSITVVFGAANDIIVALGAMGLFGIPLGVPSIAGILMLLGYSIDTDMLTAIRILKRTEGTVEERAYGSMRTGITMTMTAIVSFSVLFIVSLIAYVPTYYEISGVVLCGLIGDIATTWLGNAPMIMLYKKRKLR